LRARRSQSGNASPGHLARTLGFMASPAGFFANHFEMPGISSSNPAELLKLRIPARSLDRFSKLCPPFPRERRLDSASLLRRVFELDVLGCSSCGGGMRVIALIEDGDVSNRILEPLGLQAQVPAPSPVRAPPTPIPSSDAELVCDGIDEHAAPWMNSEPGTD